MERVGSVTSSNEFFTQFLFNQHGYVDEEGNVFIIEKGNLSKKRIGFVNTSGSIYFCNKNDDLDFVGHVDKTGDIWIAEKHKPVRVGFVLFSNVYARGDVYTGERGDDQRYQYDIPDDKNQETQRKIFRWGAAALILTSPMHR